ncbi:sensor histidine kinase [Massilia sp. BSC265]|uniref:sensor histidine kinase n=1 Tax=Massilia sp. BSC265 TaxID=1549812 RepID=UPI0004E8F5CC|nr:histidine kinase [Massilia sp. BSC265]KFI05715.1 histidine kinase [Massilia sp. BSC265]
MSGAFWARRSSALYLLAWLMLGVLLAGLIIATTGASPGAVLLFALPLTLCYAIACGFSSYYLCRAYPLAQRSLGAVLLVFFFSGVSAALLWCAAGSAWAALCRLLLFEVESVEVDRPFAALMLGIGVLLYWMTAVGHYLALEFERARRAETRELESRLLAQDAELRMLRTQIDPHFLFNSLNSVSALTSIDPGLARDMTLQLAGFFRQTLGLEAHRKVRLRDELELVERFLAIEGVRFGPRLASEHSVGEDALECLLPPMILQPLVENAVKHGIAGLLDGGTIRLAAERAGSLLRIRVENDADPDEAGTAKTGKGIGLVNVRQRLAAAYGREGSVHWAREDATFRVELVLPAETEEK